MPSKSSSKGPSPRARTAAAHNGAKMSPPASKGGKGKGKGGGNAKGELVGRATNYVAGDYMAIHETRDPRYEWNDEKRRQVEVCCRYLPFEKLI